MPDNVFSVRDALKQARRFYDELSLSPLAAAAKYGPDYEPVTDEECLEVRRMIDVAIPLVDKIEEAAEKRQFEEDCKVICRDCRQGAKIVDSHSNAWWHPDMRFCAATVLRRTWEERHVE